MREYLSLYLKAYIIVAGSLKLPGLVASTPPLGSLPGRIPLPSGARFLVVLLW